ncbi:MAG TPA: ABC transporter substrate-binding protein [Casimicrobiaceae bacterium]|jgi:NitT/TauT family transport system substrate-binding protein|nr:ABC transporter substrate-binding protein [Casimicrobiaceae bacterium]
MKISKMLAGFSAVCIALGIAVAPAQAQAPALKKITFLTNYTFHGRHSPFFVGLDKGYYREAGFDLDIQPATGSGFVITAVDSGKADYGMAEAASVVQGVAKGAKVKSFMVFTDISTSGLASLEPYKTLESLKGKRIAASQTDSARVILPILLDRAKIDPSSVQWLAADPGVYSSLLLSGQTDLFTASIDGDIPALEKVAAPRGKTVYFSSFADWGYDVFGYLLIAKDTSLASDPDSARRFADATRKAVEYSIANPEETARIMVKHNPALNYDTTLAQWRQTIKSIDTPYEKKNGYGAATEDRVQRTIDLVKTAMKLDTGIKAQDIYQPVMKSR